MKKQRKKRPYLLIIFLVTFISIFLSLFPHQFIKMLESKTFDFRFLIRGERPHGGQVVVVAIDDKSLQEIGRWPWSREKIAQLITEISNGGAKTIGVDILFPEPQINEMSQAAKKLKIAFEKIEGEGESYNKLLNRLPKLSTRKRKKEAYRTVKKLKSINRKKDERRTDFINLLDRIEEEDNVDEILAKSIADAGNVILVYAATQQGELENKDIPDVIYDYEYMRYDEVEDSQPLVRHNALVPIKIIQESAQSMGLANTVYDADGAIRWASFAVKIGSSYFPSFGVEIARNYLGLGKSDLMLVAGDSLQLKNRHIELDFKSRAIINYLGPAGSVPTYSAVDLLNGKIAKDGLKGKAVIIGATALGTKLDVHITPFGEIPGVEKQAAVVENTINESFLSRKESLEKIELLIIIGLTIILGFALFKLRAKAGAIVSTLFFFGYIATTQYYFLAEGLWMSMVVPSFHIFMLYSTVTGYRFLKEERQAKETKRMFSSYVTERVVNELIKNPEMAKVGGHRNNITVLFSDIRGFTTYSENRKPEEVVAILNEYLAAMTDVVFKWNGTLDKFVGDEIMAFWGDPLKQERHAELAVRCALHMMTRLAELQEKWKSEGLEPLDIGIGINTGDVLVGNIGAEGKKMDYTIIGDHVNLGARVEALTRDYNTHILITEFTYEKVKHLIVDEQNPLPRNAERGSRIAHANFKEIEAVKVKGKERPVMVYDLIGLTEAQNKHHKNLQNKGK